MRHYPTHAKAERLSERIIHQSSWEHELDATIVSIGRLASEGMSRHEAIAAAFEEAITDKYVSAGSRLPTVRRLAAELGVSEATVAAGYRLLSARGWTRGETGRGTYVLGDPGSPPISTQTDPLVTAPHHHAFPLGRRPIPWRRRAVIASAARLRAAYPGALDCTSGKPDTNLLLSEMLIRSWQSALDETTHADLQYASPEPAGALVSALNPRLARDAIHVGDKSMVVGSSAQQLMILCAGLIPTFSRTKTPLIAVEEPGYQTVFDAFETQGCRLIGMELDREGVIPDSLDAALNAGAHLVLFTPRAQNPVGATWTHRRRQALADVLARYPAVLVVEDDHFADMASTSCGSLLNDPRIADRVVYIRSFAKSIAPDIRVAIALAHPHLRNLLSEAKSFTDGWTSRLSQRALAHLLADEQLDQVLSLARTSYCERRKAVTDLLVSRLGPAGGVINGTDGLNLWISLAPGSEAGEVAERAAKRGVLVTPGEPFYVHPGNNHVLRMSIGGLEEGQAITAAEQLTDAALVEPGVPTTDIPI